MMYLRNFIKSSRGLALPLCKPTKPSVLYTPLHNTFFGRNKPNQFDELVSQVNQGLAALQTENIDQSLTHFQEALRQFTVSQGKTPMTDNEQELILRTHYELGRIYEKREEYIKALDHFAAALDLSQTTDRKATLEQGDINFSLGRVLLKQAEANRSDARSHFTKGREIFKDLANRNQLDARVLDNEQMRSMLTSSEGRTDKILEMLEAIVEDQPHLARSLSRDVDISMVYLSIGDIHLNSNQNRKAVDYWDKALATAHKFYGSNSEEAIGLYHAMGQTLLREERYIEARSYIEESVHLSKTHLGEQHPKYAESLLLKAFMEFRQKYYPDALKDYQAGLEILSKNEGKYQGEIWMSYLAMAEIHLAEGNEAQAHEAFNKADQVMTKTLGKNHPEIAGYYLYWADLLKYKVNNTREAKEFYTRALDIYLRSGNIQEPRIIDVFYEIGPRIFKSEPYVYYFTGVLHFQQQKYDESATSLLKAMDANEDEGGAALSDLDIHCHNLAQAFEKKGIVDKYVELMERTLEISAKYRGGNDETTKQWFRMLKNKLVKLGRHEDAQHLSSKFNL